MAFKISNKLKTFFQIYSKSAIFSRYSVLNFKGKNSETKIEYWAEETHLEFFKRTSYTGLCCRRGKEL